ncbi:hypothetical protein HMPREF0262_01609 [Clostridium sp. ATCC 29733]|nr:hypothetical protein HMPREF0262_01609 [Clostridium sp. ATCC 29733]
MVDAEHSRDFLLCQLGIFAQIFEPWIGHKNHLKATLIYYHTIVLTILSCDSKIVKLETFILVLHPRKGVQK